MSYDVIQWSAFSRLMLVEELLQIRENRYRWQKRTPAGCRRYHTVAVFFRKNDLNAW